MENTLRVNFFGTFSLEYGGKRVSCDANRSKRVWILIAYIIYNHSRIISQNELLEVLWNDEKERANPAGALKAALYRARALLEELELGGELIVYKNGGYTVGDGIALELDSELFEELCRSKDYTEALKVYKGDFLSKLSSSVWTLPLSAYYQNMYTGCLYDYLPILFEKGDYAKGEELCRTAVRILPYEEAVYTHLMRMLIALEKKQEAAEVYEQLSKLLMENFGVVPSEPTKELYREAMRTVNRSSVSPVMINEQLRESGPIEGALVCDYDFFKLLYQAEARLIARNGNAVHIAILTIVSAKGFELTPRTTESSMEFLGEHLRKSLRKGDVISKCSPTQYVIMLSNASFENSCMVCDRVISGYKRLKPHSPAAIEYTVHPLDPREECAPPASFRKS